MNEQPEGKPIKELREIVARDLARLERIQEVWSSLSDDQQEDLACQAEAMSTEDD